MGVSGVGGNQSFIDKLAAQVEDLAAGVQDFVEDLEAGGQSAGETASAGFLQQHGNQIRSRLEAVLAALKPSGDLATAGTAAPAPRFESKPSKPGEVGAYYHKVVTDASKESLALETTRAVAPEVKIDNSRYLFFDGSIPANSGKPQAVDFAKNKSGVTLAEMNNPATGPKDRPSIYMGGNSNGVEVDAGLAWNRVVKSVDNRQQSIWTTAANGSSRTEQFVINPEKDAKNQITGYKVQDLDGNVIARGKDFKPNADGSVSIGDKTLRPNFAFRPFFRSTDKGGNGAVGYHDQMKMPDGSMQKILIPGGRNDVQVYAGEKFDMKMTAAKNSNKVQLEITSDYGKYSYSPEVRGFRGGNGAATLKRVDSIDQKGKEKGKTDPTQTTVSNGAWGATSIAVGNRRDSFVGAAGTHIKSLEFSEKFANNDNSIFGSQGKGRTTRVDGSEQIYINPPDAAE